MSDDVMVDEDGTRWVRQRNADVRLVEGQVYVRQPTLHGRVLAKMETTEGVDPGFPMEVLEIALPDGPLRGVITDRDGMPLLNARSLTEPGFFDRLLGNLRQHDPVE